jgi:iron complex transport system ATP-binding protein
VNSKSTGAPARDYRSNLLDVDGLSVRIGNTQVCRGLDLNLERGQCWGMLGRNGSGKTTLLRTLAGLRAPERGQIRVKGKRVKELPRRVLARTVGVLFQENSESFPTTALESVLMGRHPYLAPWQWEGRSDRWIALRALSRVGLEHAWFRSTDTMSGGEQRRIAIARLLAQSPQIAFLDEPTNHLDLGQQIRVLDLLAGRVRHGERAMLMVLHDVNLALRYCDHLLLLFGDGRVSQGKSSEIATEAALGELYRRPVSLISGPHGPLAIPG